MGGHGSGRWGSHTKKTTVEECRSLDASLWAREKILEEGTFRSGAWHWTDSSTGEKRASIRYEVHATLEGLPAYVWFRYSLARSGENLDYKVLLEITRPRLGGLRWWFICPLCANGRTCGRRVGKLYLPPGGKYFGCRHCYDLTYKSSQTSHSRIKRLFLQYGIRR